MSEQLLKELLEGQQLIIKTLQMHSVQLEDLQKGQSRLETRIENEIIEKLRGLYDDREVQNDRFDRIESKLDDMATDISYIAAKIAGFRKLAR